MRMLFTFTLSEGPTSTRQTSVLPVCTLAHVAAFSVAGPNRTTRARAWPPADLARVDHAGLAIGFQPLPAGTSGQASRESALRCRTQRNQALD